MFRLLHSIRQKVRQNAREYRTITAYVFIMFPTVPCKFNFILYALRVGVYIDQNRGQDYSKTAGQRERRRKGHPLIKITFRGGITHRSVQVRFYRPLYAYGFLESWTTSEGNKGGQ